MLQRGLSLLTEPMLRAFLLKGLGVPQRELEEGAVAAYNTVMPMLNADVAGPSGLGTDEALSKHVDPSLLRVVLSPGYKDRLPVASEAIAARQGPSCRS